MNFAGLSIAHKNKTTRSRLYAYSRVNIINGDVLLHCASRWGILEASVVIGYFYINGVVVADMQTLSVLCDEIIDTLQPIYQ
jgi:hypothetical protein